MRVLNFDEMKLNRESLKKQIIEGALFIHPTDTIYGLGCDATNEKAVQKLRELKNRHKKPYSVIAPSKAWIRENCLIDGNAEEWLGKLPGPYTLILKLKNPKSIPDMVRLDSQHLGVRIPHHWISEAVAEFGKPIVTTSANKAGKEFMTSLENLDPEIKNNVDFILYEGEKDGRPSKIVDLTGDSEEVIER